MIIKHTFAVGRPQQTLVKYIYLPPETHQIRIPSQEGFSFAMQAQTLEVSFCPSHRKKYRASVTIHDRQQVLLAKYELWGRCTYPAIPKTAWIACIIALLGCWVWWYSAKPPVQAKDLALTQLDTLRIGATVSYIDKDALQVKFRRCGFKGVIGQYATLLPLDSLITLLAMGRINGIVTEHNNPAHGAIVWSTPYAMHEETDGLKLGLWQTDKNKKIIANFSNN